MGGIKHPATFVPNKVYDNVGLYDIEMKISSDTDFILRCYFDDIKFIVIPSILSNMSEGGISTNHTIDSIKAGYKDYVKRIGKYDINILKKYYLLFRYCFMGVMKIICQRVS
jgi:glycosyltransferase